MASEIRVNKITHTAGVGTITTNVDGIVVSGIITGTTFSGSGASLTSIPAANVTGTLPAISGANLTNLPAANITGTLPAISGANLTNLTATNLTGTIADARFPATLPAASAANLTSIPAANVTGTLPAISAANLTQIPAANIVGVCTAGFERTGGFGGGKILQIVQFTTSSTNNYASVDFQNTVVQISVTPTAADSKFLIKSVMSFGIGSKQCAVSFNFSDSLHASGTTHPIAPMSGDGTNGASNSRLPAYFGIGSFDDASDVDNYFVGNATGEYLYTPAYQNTNARAFTVMVRSSFGDNVRFNMNAHYNAANPRDMRPMSSITVMEVAA